MPEEVVGAHTRWKARYHFVWGTKYLKEVVVGICERYGYTFDALGTDGDHVHLLVGPTPSQSPEVMMKSIKSISARKLFERFPSLRNLLWGGAVWAVGYYWATVGDGRPEKLMREYVLNQGTEKEKQLVQQLRLL